MKFLRSLSVLVLVALAAGLAVGALAAAFGGEPARRIIEAVEALGGLWLNALRMTVIPLIFAVFFYPVAVAVGVGSAVLLTVAFVALVRAAQRHRVHIGH